MNPTPLTDRARIAEHLACLRAIVGGERSPIGREWNHAMSARERAFWARAAGIGPTHARIAATAEWKDLAATDQTAIRLALTRAAARAVHLLHEGGRDA